MVTGTYSGFCLQGRPGAPRPLPGPSLEELLAARCAESHARACGSASRFVAGVLDPGFIPGISQDPLMPGAFPGLSARSKP